MLRVVDQVNSSHELEIFVNEGFKQHAIESAGSDGDMRDFNFEVRDGDSIVGAGTCRLFWGALHIKKLFTAPHARYQGIGTALMKRMLMLGQKEGCSFAFVETMSFQALEFYLKQGFHLEFSRPGYAQNTTFHYLKLNLDLNKDYMAK